MDKSNQKLNRSVVDNDTLRKPLSIRIIHWSVALLFAVAFATAYLAFDFRTEMPIKVRDGLFAAHRLSGMIAGLLIFLWLIIRLKSMFRSIRVAGSFQVVGAFHIVLGLACFAVPILPWIARSQDGRAAELYSLWPVFNLVSHPTTDLVYKLLHQHKQLADVVAILLGLHIVGALFHRFILKDKLLWTMSFGKR